jgi:PAS domain S-box-containing protein
MDFNLIRGKNFNSLLLVLVASQLVLLAMTLILFASNSMNGPLPISSVTTAVLLLLFCIPICIVIYRSNIDELSNKIFRALLLNFIALSISGTTWYILNIEQLGTVFLVLSYIPLLATLYKIYDKEKEMLKSNVKWFIIFFNFIFVIFLSYYFVSDSLNYNNFNYVSYTFLFVVIGDVTLLTLITILLLINMPTKSRYLYSILFGYIILSFIGDSARLLGLFDIILIYDYSYYLYDIMFIFISIALLIYAFSNIKISSVEEMNKKLQDTTIVVQDLIIQSPDAMCMCSDDGLIIQTNDQFLNALNLKKDDTVNKIKIFDEIPKLINVDSNIIQKVRSGETVLINDIKINVNGKPKYYIIKFYPTYSVENKISSYVFVAEDITQRKYAEDELKNAYDQMENRVKERTAELSILNNTLQNEIIEHKKDEEKIISSLKEKEVLLKEIHHRVKNNMQIISSMLGLQSAYVNDNHLNDILKDSQNRIKSMALIHEKLYQSNNMANVDFNEYVNGLVKNLYYSYTINNEKIIVSSKIEKAAFNIDLAIPLGLIINELVSNSLKHAFPNDKQGQIDIVIKSIENNMFELTVKDNGIGLSDNIDVNNTRTLGLNLVNALVSQIDGTLSITNDNGAEFKITFPHLTNGM